MKQQYDSKKKEARTYREGENVWLETTNLKLNRPSKKLAERRLGPFKIIQKIGNSSYKLQLPSSWKSIHSTFNESLLTPYVEASFKSQKKPKPLPPDLIEGEKEYEIENIHDSRKKGRGIQFLIHWKGYPSEEDSWEPRRHLDHAKKLLQDFHRKYPNKPF